MLFFIYRTIICPQISVLSRIKSVPYFKKLTGIPNLSCFRNHLNLKTQKIVDINRSWRSDIPSSFFFFCTHSKSRREYIKFASSLSPYLHVKKLYSSWTNFNEIWYWKMLLKFIRSLYFRQKFYKYNGPSTWRFVGACRV